MSSQGWYYEGEGEDGFRKHYLRYSDVLHKIRICFDSAANANKFKSEIKPDDTPADVIKRALTNREAL